jgi:para-nitrobenzyl esterase
MKRVASAITAALLFYLALTWAPPAQAADRVRVADGVLEGAPAQPDGSRVFLGIPFARAPVGALRWRAPQDAIPWKGIRKADTFGPHCMQESVFADIEFRSQGMSEDCLYLNVWTAAKSEGEHRPVLVYLHGGGFIAGDGSESRYDGASMARQGIVVVTLNYRLGVFGFLAHPELSRETEYHGSGNYGLLDQAAALRWVRKNIAAFGGNPEHITVAGESAGSISVSALMASPLSRGSIAGAIGESGSILGALSAVPLAQAESAGREFAAQAGAKSLAELRALPAARILAAARSRAPRFAPTVDGYFLPESPFEIYRKAEQARVPLLAGSNSEEMSAAAVLGPQPATPEGYRRAVEKLYGDQAEVVLKAYPAGSDRDSVLDAAQQLAGDRFIAQSTWKWMQLVTEHGGRPTFYYRYTRTRPPLTPQAAARLEPRARELGFPITPARGAVHASEIEYALGNLDLHPIYQWQADDYAVSRAMQAYFVNFIKTGDPNGRLPRWPAYDSGQRMIIDVQPHAEPDTEAKRRRALDALLIDRR